MTDTSAIQQRIYYQQAKIAEYENDIAQIRRTISKMDEAEQMIYNKKQQLNRIQSHDLEKISRISMLDINPKIIGPLAEGMKADLTGAAYQGAYDGLNAICHKIENKIYEQEKIIQQKRMQINRLQQNIANLRYELAQAINESG